MNNIMTLKCLRVMHDPGGNTLVNTNKKMSPKNKNYFVKKASNTYNIMISTI